MPANIIPIVEGHGEVYAVPILIRRIAQAGEIYDVQVRPPIRCPRQKLIKQGELERAVELAARKVGGDGQIIVILDAEGDCPAKLGPQLLARAAQARGNIPIAVVIAKQEYEAWFLGSLESLHPGAASPSDPESIHGAKERLAALMGAPYSEVLDQPAMTAQFAMDEARSRCPSFDKCWRAIESLLL